MASYNYPNISKDVLVLNNKECMTFQIFIREKYYIKSLRKHPTLNWHMWSNNNVNNNVNACIYFGKIDLNKKKFYS